MVATMANDTENTTPEFPDAGDLDDASAPSGSGKTPALIAREVARRRTFGIISHPDAGKTTLTEKLLLFSGAIQMAGTVKARKSGRHATSDWMEIEAQTIKLLAVCRMRNTPIVTFMNKMDRETRDPLELLDELESVLKIQCAPVTWPIGMGKNFRGVYHLLKDEIMLFKAGEEKADGAFEIIKGIDNPRLQEMFPLEMDQLRMEVELVHGASHPFDLQEFLSGVQTPVFFGSAINNFGVREILSALVEWAPAPRERDATVRVVDPSEQPFTGFVFKIQANMDPAHRDRIAF